jgi:hypothetical protein
VVVLSDGDECVSDVRRVVVMSSTMVQENFVELCSQKALFCSVWLECA